MKNAKRIITLLLALTLVFALASCGDGDKRCSVCSDEDFDGVCDVCKKDMPEEPVEDFCLFEGGVPYFQFVLAENLTQEVRNTVNLDIKQKLKTRHNINVDVKAEGGYGDKIEDYEILVGDVQNRGSQYTFDRYSLGKEGYIIKIIGTKVIINAGSDEMLVNVLEDFAEDVMKIKENDIGDVFMTAADMKHVVQSDYNITALKVNGNDMRGYTIAADLTRDFYEDAAKTLRETIYDRTGYYFKIVDIENATEKSIIMKHVDSASSEDSFKVSANGSQLVFECTFDNMLDKASAQFSLEKITMANSGELNFTGKVYNQDISVVYYEDFGAKGDGRTDDFKAIYDTHEFANISGQTVKATPGKTYYMFDSRWADGAYGVSQHSVIIKTNVDWQGADIVIDDREISYLPTHANYGLHKDHVFIVSPDDNLEKVRITDRQTLDALVEAGFNRSTTEIDLEIDGWDGDLMIMPSNSTHKIFRRKGYADAFAGKSMEEVIVIDKDGNISSETPITFDYTSLDYIDVYKLDKTSAITIQNGTVTTRYCQFNNADVESMGVTTSPERWCWRGISVQRSYTTVKNVKHYVTDEFTLAEAMSGSTVKKCGVSYAGFFTAKNASNVTFEDCILTGRRLYNGVGRSFSATYEISLNAVNKIVFKNCIQHNFFVTVDSSTSVIKPATAETQGAITSMSPYNFGGKNMQLHWGAVESNFCKNLEFIGSTISRFDAHEGLYNGKIIDSTVNYIELTGWGDFIMENSTWYQPLTYDQVGVVTLRGDYGCTWDGDIKITDLKAYINHSAGKTELISHGHYNWYFGYTTAFPNISIHNADFYNVTTRQPIEAGYEIKLTSSITKTSKMHLSVCNGDTIWSVEDKDDDGYVDEPALNGGMIDYSTDLDSDGKAGNTKFKYDDIYSLLGGSIQGGYADPTLKVNLNIVIPPEYIKITGNDGVDGSGGYLYFVPNTSGQGISDGLFYNDTDSFGGFFGGTKFIYGDGKNDYFVGTDKTANSAVANSPFKIK